MLSRRIHVLLVLALIAAAGASGASATVGALSGSIPGPGWVLMKITMPAGGSVRVAAAVSTVDSRFEADRFVVDSNNGGEGWHVADRHGVDHVSVSSEAAPAELEHASAGGGAAGFSWGYTLTSDAGETAYVFFTAAFDGTGAIAWSADPGPGAAVEIAAGDDAKLYLPEHFGGTASLATKVAGATIAGRIDRTIKHRLYALMVGSSSPNTPVGASQVSVDHPDGTYSSQGWQGEANIFDGPPGDYSFRLETNVALGAPALPPFLLLADVSYVPLSARPPGVTMENARGVYVGDERVATTPFTTRENVLIVGGTFTVVARLIERDFPISECVFSINGMPFASPPPVRRADGTLSCAAEVDPPAPTPPALLNSLTVLAVDSAGNRAFDQVSMLAIPLPTEE